jgi:hypothetical protein
MSQQTAEAVENQSTQGTNQNNKNNCSKQDKLLYSDTEASEQPCQEEGKE